MYTIIIQKLINSNDCFCIDNDIKFIENNYDQY